MKHSKIYFDKRAKEYDKDVDIFPGYLQAINKIVELANLKGEEIVLDLGCGTGNLTLEIAKKVKRVIAVDFSEKMIAVARHKAKSLGLENIEFKAKDIRDIDLENFVDLAVSNFVIHHLIYEDKIEVLFTIYRALKKNGRVIIGDIVGKEEDFKKSNKILKENYKRKYGRVSGYLKNLHHVIMHSLLTKEYPEDSTTWGSIMERVGFENIKVSKVEAGVGVVYGEKL
jgi:ubiquinone/menaquinone biosynthesis C-methylase UbiE